MSELQLLHIPFLDFDNIAQRGELVTHKTQASALLDIFSKIMKIGFPIFAMKPICYFAGSDEVSMRENNTSCFNTRKILGSDRVSDHSFGRAVDINPIQNPVIRDGIVRPPEGKAFASKRTGQGVIDADGAVVEIFANAGWQWGGDWKNPRDYHHFYTRLNP